MVTLAAPQLIWKDAAPQLIWKDAGGHMRYYYFFWKYSFQDLSSECSSELLFSCLNYMLVCYLADNFGSIGRNKIDSVFQYQLYVFV